MTAETFPGKAQELVYEHVKKRLEPTDAHVNFSLDEVYVVSFSFVLSNWKALVSTTLPNGMYYEVTRDFKLGVTYITAYKQWEHETVADREIS